jgi:uncharacterized protein (DUF934 family)
MRQLIRRREIVSDDWRYADEDPQGRDRALILPFARWQQERNRWWLWDGRLGVRLGPADPVAALAQDFLRISLVAIEFGGIAEGRGYSQAQLLRKRYKFSGELRAVGKVQRDQLFYLARCGFDSFRGRWIAARAQIVGLKPDLQRRHVRGHRSGFRPTLPVSCAARCWSSRVPRDSNVSQRSRAPRCSSCTASPNTPVAIAT